MRGRLSREEATAKLGGLEMTQRGTARQSSASSSPAAARPATRRWSANTSSRRSRTSRRRSSSPASSATATCRCRRTRSSSCISQSGETADTLAALRESQRKGHRTLGICNNVASHHRARERRRRLHARRPGDRRRGDEIVHLAGHDPHAHRPAARAASGISARAKACASSTNSKRIPDKVATHPRAERPHQGDRARNTRTRRR